MRITITTALIALVLVVSCEDDDPVTCVVDGVTHAVGDTFPASDGCNTCSCGADGAVACTLIGCVTTCTYDGATHAVGATYPATDGCNTCTCTEAGTSSCTEMACPMTCTYDGQTYEPGDTFPSTDECNTCSCGDDGTVACTTLACLGTCTYDRQEWTEGDTFPSIDGCNTCTCAAEGQIVCTLEECITTCTYDRQEWQIGDTFPAIDGCNTCTCELGGNIGCTEQECPTTCTYDRQEWQIGDVFPAIDGCNTCTCLVGGVLACTKELCICDPTTEWWRSYTLTDPDACAAADLACPPSTSTFENDCGCGCEQSDTCEREIECIAPECDASEALAACPYSQIDTTPKCSAEASCPSDQGADTCHDPGAPFGCGICMNPPEETTCQDDRGCEGDTICQPLRCACQGQKVCVPGCTTADDCGDGEACGDDGRCVAATCDDVSAPCPGNFACVSGGCARIACTASTECSGFCVNGSCYGEPGECRALPQ